MGFFKAWGKGIKDHAKSPLGTLETQVIILCFLFFGLMLGAVERHLRGDGTLAFILFAFGLFQLTILIPLWKQYKTVKHQIKLINEASKRS